MDLSRSVKGSTVLVTGAASGMGRATAEVFAAEGAHVALTDLRVETVREAADDLVHRGFSAEAWGLDVADAARRGGRLDGEGYTALRLYQRVLALEPDNVRALEGREDTLSELLAQSRSMLERGALTDAAAVQRRVAQADAGHVELPEARAALAAAVDARLSRAEADLQRGRLAEALAGFRAALDSRD